MTEWSEASGELIHIAQEIVTKYYPGLKEARIGFVFRDEAQKSNGKELAGSTAKVSPKEQVYLDLDFLIWVSEKDWTAMASDVREALIDHLLAHCAGNPYTGWKIRPHDIEEFAVVISRRGLWNHSLMRINSALDKLLVTQGELLLDAINKKPGGVVAVKPAEMEQHAPIDES